MEVEVHLLGTSLHHPVVKTVMLNILSVIYAYLCGVNHRLPCNKAGKKLQATLLKSAIHYLYLVLTNSVNTSKEKPCYTSPVSVFNRAELKVKTFPFFPLLPTACKVT